MGKFFKDMFYNTSSKKVIAETIHSQNFLWEQ